MLINEEYNSELLDVSSVEVGQEYNKIAYLMDIKSGLSKIEQGFYTFYFKDVHANVVVGRLFGIEDYINNGLIATALKRKPVRIHFVAQEYNGSISLILRNIEWYTGEFDYSSFIGKIDGTKASVSFVSQVFTKLRGTETKVPAEYETLTLSKVAGGKCGGYAKLLEMVTQRVISYKDLVGINIAVIGDVLYNTQSLYCTYLKRLDATSMITNSELVKFINDCYVLNANEKQLKIIIDTMTGLLGLGKPEHLYANILCNSIKDCMNILDTCDMFSTMIVGARKEVGELTLVKY